MEPTVVNEPVSFFVEGIPATAGSKRHVGGGRIIDSCKRKDPWARCVAVACVKHTGSSEPVFAPHTPVGVRFVIVLPRPDRPAHKIHPVVKPDALKYARAAEDALTGILWHDDAATVDLHIQKRYAKPNEPTGLHVLAWAIT